MMLYTKMAKTLEPLPMEINSFTQGQNGCHFADNIFKCIFLNEDARIFIQISLKFVPKGAIDNSQH